MNVTAPFSPVLDRAGLPPIFTDQYLLPFNVPYYLEFTGQMHRIWQTDKRLSPLFWLLARFDILFPETGENVPAKVIIHSGRDGWERPFHDWQRIYHFPEQTRRSNARLVFDPVRGLPVEIFRPGGMLHIGWQVRFEPPFRLRISTTFYQLSMGRFRLPLPDWLRGRVTAVETADPNIPNRIHLTFVLSYPRVGPVFGYNGTFDCVRRPYRLPQRSAPGIQAH